MHLLFLSPWSTLSIGYITILSKHTENTPLSVLLLCGLPVLLYSRRANFKASANHWNHFTEQFNIYHNRLSTHTLLSVYSSDLHTLYVRVCTPCVCTCHLHTPRVRVWRICDLLWSRASVCLHVRELRVARATLLDWGAS